jgi:integrase
MSYSQPKDTTGHSLAGLMAQWRSQATEPERDRLGATRHFFARLLKHLYPSLPDLPSSHQIGGWFHRVDEQALPDVRRIIQTLKDPALAPTLGISQPTLRSYRYRLLPFLIWYGHYRAQLAIPSQTLSKAWKALFEDAYVAQLHRCPRSYLHKLSQFATKHGISPEELDTDFTAQFRTWLKEESGLGDPLRVYRGARQAWNALSTKGLLPALSFYMPTSRPTHTLSLEDLPTAYRQLWESYERDAHSPDPDDWPTADPHRSHPLTEATLQTRLRYLLAYWGALSQYADVDLTQTNPVEVFATEHYIEWYADFLAERAQGKCMTWHQGQLSWLCLFALEYLPRHAPDVPILLTSFKDKLFKEQGHRRSQRPGYVPPETVEKVLSYMEDRLDHLDKDRRSGAPTTFFSIRRDYFLIAFFLDHGNRSADLRRAQLGREFIEEEGHYIAQFKTKNGRLIRSTLSPRTHRALQRYLASRQALGWNDATLILSHRGSPLSHSALWSQITRWFRRAVGLHYSPHDFRRTLASSVLKKTGDQDLAKLLLDRKGTVGALSPPTAKLLARLQDPQLAKRFRAQVERSAPHAY